MTLLSGFFCCSLQEALVWKVCLVLVYGEGVRRTMCERPVSVAFIVARNRVRMAVFAGLKSEFWLAFWSFREESHNYRIAMTSRWWRLELRVYVTKLQKSKDGEFRFVHRCTRRCLVRFHFARNELILVALYREALCVSGSSFLCPLPVALNL